MVRTQPFSFNVELNQAASKLGIAPLHPDKVLDDNGRFSIDMVTVLQDVPPEEEEDVIQVIMTEVWMAFIGGLEEFFNQFRGHGIEEDNPPRMIQSGKPVKNTITVKVREPEEARQFIAEIVNGLGLVRIQPDEVNVKRMWPELDNADAVFGNPFSTAEKLVMSNYGNLNI